MKNMPDTSISRVYKYLFSEQWFYTVSGTFVQIKSANMLGWNIFLIQGLKHARFTTDSNGKTSR